jgi:NADH-quinone oxidoreductase subunit D
MSPDSTKDAPPLTKTGTSSPSLPALGGTQGARRTLAMGAPALEDLERGSENETDAVDADELPTEPMTINMGPSHPAMHGTVRIVLTVEGERVVGSDVQVGYLHRCFEKEAEAATYAQVFPYTDRLNYVSPMLNNVGYALAVEKLLGITDQIPERASYIRVIVGEISRITDHMTCLGASAMELGAFTPFLWLIKSREWLWELLEQLSGARLTHSFVRIGGVANDLPVEFAPKLRAVLDKADKTLADSSAVLTKNRIFRDRLENVGAISQQDAIAWGFTGPCLRSTGVDYDVRKDHPYLVYDRFDFEVPVGTRGDNYDRYLVRVEEMVQSIRILRQALDQLPPGPVLIDNPRIALPPKAEAYNTIEGMINHFKLIIDGIKVPAGEVYGYTEAGNGELGFYIVSDGTGRPYKCRVRPPSFAIVQALGSMIQGQLISDIVPTFGMMNMIGGECDR